MHQTLRLCGQRVCAVYGDWQVHRKVIVMGLILQGQGQGCHPMSHTLQQILMCHRWHLLIVVSQVVLKKTVTNGFANGNPEPRRLYEQTPNESCACCVC